MKLQPRDLEAATLCADTLARCTYPFDRVALDVVIPVEVADLSRYMRQHLAVVRGATGGKPSASLPGDAADLPDHGHVDVYADLYAGALDERVEHGHGIIIRNAVWGLYWLPTTAHPAGRIAIERSLAPVNQQKTLLAEVWHGLDYTVMDDTDRHDMLLAYHGGHHWTAVGHVRDWFEEEGELDYRDWCGEAGMGDFIRIASDYDASDFSFFTHKTTPLVLDTMRRVLWRHAADPEPVPEPEPPVLGIRCKAALSAICRRVFHRPECRIVRLMPIRYVPLEQSERDQRRGCKVCRP